MSLQDDQGAHSPIRDRGLQPEFLLDAFSSFGQRLDRKPPRQVAPADRGQTVRIRISHNFLVGQGVMRGDEPMLLMAAEF